MTRPHLEAGRLVWDDVALDDVAATFGTPTYIYSRATLESAAEAFETAFASRPGRRGRRATPRRSRAGAAT